MSQVVAAYFAEEVGALPLLGLLIMRTFRKRITAPWWWLAAALAASWVADRAVALGANAWIASPAYLVTQGTLGAAAFLPLARVWPVLTVLVLTGVVAVALGSGQRPDLLLHVVAFGLIVGLAWGSDAAPRLMAFWIFGGCLAVWLVYCWGWWSHDRPMAERAWWAYQGVRATGALGFLLMAWRAR